LEQILYLKLHDTQYEWLQDVDADHRVLQEGKREGPQDPKVDALILPSMESPSLWSIPTPMKKGIPNNAPNYSFLFKKISIFPAKGDSSSLPNEKGLPTAISTIPSPFKSPTIIESPKRAFNQQYSRK
jgi:hypothetical protein